MTTQRNRRSTPCTAGIYIDLENLGFDNKSAANSIKFALENWRKDFPRISSISAYGKTSTVQWETAINGMVDELMKEVWPFSNETPVVKVIDTSSHGRRHTGKTEKNTADVKLAMDACQDILSGEVNFIAVISNDSDFLSLYEKVKYLKDFPDAGRFPYLNASNGRDDHAPFVIINHQTGAKVSPDTKDLMDEPFRIELPKKSLYPPTVITDNEIAEAVVREINVGEFNDNDIFQIINGSERLKKHQALRLPAGEFPQFIKESIWPLLENYGVVQLQEKPPKYAVSETIKNKLDEAPQKNTTDSKDSILINEPDTESISEHSDGRTEEIEEDDIIKALATDLLVGGFRHWWARKAIEKRWPSHFSLELGGVAFDNQFLRKLIGKETSKENPKILIPRDTFTRLYEIPPTTKGKEGPNLSELVAEVVDKVRLESFTTADVVKVIEDRWPNYAVTRSRPLHDPWFHYNLWPLLKLTERDAGTKKDIPEDGKYSLNTADIKELQRRFAQAKKGATE